MESGGMFALIVLSVMAVLAAFAAPAGATLPGRSGEIAYGIVDEIDSDQGIYFAGFYIGAVEPNSGRQRRIGSQIDDDGLDAIEPAFSPDGKLMAVQWDDEPGGGIVLIRRNGAPVRRLTHGHYRSPTWAPSGQRIAFDRRRCGEEQDVCDSLGIHTIGVDGRDQRMIVDAGVDPSWSAKGAIAFVATRRPWRFYANEGPIRVRGPGGSETRTLVAEGADPDWSPRGTTLVFVRSRGQHSGLFVVNGDGSGLHRIHVVKNRSVTSPVWSPSGRRIAFLLGDGLYTISPSGRDRRRIRTIQYDYEGSLSRADHLDWQPLPRRR
jgi:Tol biopolymer transport system component